MERQSSLLVRRADAAPLSLIGHSSDFDAANMLQS